MDGALRIRPEDTVAVALQPLATGEAVEAGGARVTLIEDIPMGHKLALRDIAPGEAVIKYGHPIGEATRDIPAGSLVHTHNLRSLLRGEGTYAWRPVRPRLEKAPPASFSGYRREDGRVGIRNELWIIPTVGCVNDTAAALARAAQRLVGPGVDGVCAFRHPYGCSQLGGDQDATRQILAGLCGHPNAGGALLLGLGCENSGVETILTRMDGADHPRLRALVCQEAEDEIEAGLRLLEELAGQMARMSRTACDTRDLVVGLKCGGSDGLSGVTANPVIGGFSDRLVARGGAVLLTEVPEMFGAETILMNRCEDEATFQKTVALINGFKRYFEESGQPVYENPSPGNRAGGITTLEDKALGCTQKSGAAPVRDVLPYGGRVKTAGLSLLAAPGNDLVSSTALAAAGAQMVLFSTGRGTPLGCPVPTLKIASNSGLARRKPRWIDFDAGALLEGGTLDGLADALLSLALAVAGGQPVRSEENGCRDMAIFKNGVTL
ncbi:MAG: altronate dehydratase [Clostridia bacterium]|nr:altronate dehydratase [Clostridia bacterium]